MLFNYFNISIVQLPKTLLTNCVIVVLALQVNENEQIHWIRGCLIMYESKHSHLEIQGISFVLVANYKISHHFRRTPVSN